MEPLPNCFSLGPVLPPTLSFALVDTHYPVMQLGIGTDSEFRTVEAKLYCSYSIKCFVEIAATGFQRVRRRLRVDAPIRFAVAAEAFPTRNPSADAGEKQTTPYQPVFFSLPPSAWQSR